MNAKLIRILAAAIAGAAGAAAASGEVPEVAPVLNGVVALIGTLAPLLLRTKAGR